MTIKNSVVVIIIITFISAVRIGMIYCSVKSNQMNSGHVKTSFIKYDQSEIKVLLNEIKIERFFLRQLINETGQVVRTILPHRPYSLPPEKNPTTSSILSNNMGVITESMQNTVKHAATPLCYDRKLASGFGDRLAVYLTLAAIGRAEKREVYAFWHEENGNRHYNLDLTKIRRFVLWPRNLHILSKNEFDKKKGQCILIQYWMHERDKTNVNKHLLASNKAYDGVYTLARRTYGLPSYITTITQEEFVHAYRLVTTEIALKVKKDKDLPKNPYIALHVRGGDKLSNIENFKTIEI